MKSYLWDYDYDELKKTKSGRLLILERMINYGIYESDKEKISLSEVKKNWDKLNIEPARKKLLEFLIQDK